MSWHPQIPAGPAPVYARLVDAMERDVRSGALPPGARLPPHRDLAYTLGLSVGSITKAYAEAARRGILSAHVGRGSYVRGAAGAEVDVPTTGDAQRILDHDNMVDLRCNAPPHVSLVNTLDETIARLASSGGLRGIADYAPGIGPLSVRQAGAAWIGRRHGLAVSAADIVQCNGGQHAIAVVFSAFCRPGDVILSESTTFYGARVAADHLGLRMRGVAMDAEGIAPDALERALVETRARLLFLVPTIHNPTTRSMSAARREAVAEIARRHDVFILEDDAYHAYGDPALPKIATLAPERTLYLASISKSVCPGLRLAFLALPTGFAAERILRGIRAFGYCPPALGALAFAAWMEDGTADRIVEQVQAESGARFLAARAVLGDAIAPAGSFRPPHVWLPMSAHDADRLVMRAQREDVRITPPDVFAVSASGETGVRLCLGAPASHAQLDRALRVVASAMVARDYVGEGIV